MSSSLGPPPAVPSLESQMSIGLGVRSKQKFVGSNPLAEKLRGKGNVRGNHNRSARGVLHVKQGAASPRNAKPKSKCAIISKTNTTSTAIFYPKCFNLDDFDVFITSSLLYGRKTSNCVAAVVKQGVGTVVDTCMF